MDSAFLYFYLFYTSAQGDKYILNHSSTHCQTVPIAIGTVEVFFIQYPFSFDRLSLTNFFISLPIVRLSLSKPHHLCQIAYNFSNTSLICPNSHQLKLVSFSDSNLLSFSQT